MKTKGKQKHSHKVHFHWLWKTLQNDLSGHEMKFPLWNSLSQTLSAQSCNSDSGKTVIDIRESFASMKKQEWISGLEPSCVSFYYHLISQTKTPLKSEWYSNLKEKLHIHRTQTKHGMNCSEILLWPLF